MVGKELYHYAAEEEKMETHIESIMLFYFITALVVVSQ